MRGLLQSFESVVAILIISVFLVTFFRSTESIPEFESINRQMNGFNAIKILEKNNELRTLVVKNDTISIKNKLSPLIPAGLSYDVFVCEKECVKPNVTASKIVSVFYLFSGDFNEPLPRQLALFIWG